MNQARMSFFIVIAILFCSFNLQGQTKGVHNYLEFKKTIDGIAKVQEQDEYLISMDKSQTAIIRIERGSFDIGKEINLLITIISPENKIVDEINTANDASFIIFDSSIKGNYKVVVRRWNGAESGSFKIVLDYLSDTNSYEVKQIDKLLAHFYRSNQPGASILIQKKGKPLYKRNFGLSNFNHQIPISDSTIFDIASVSKQITAYAIAMLSVEGKLDLNESIRSYIPEFPEYGKNIAVLHLVLNVSGIRDYDQVLALSGYIEEDGDNIKSERVLSSILQFEETYFQPGTEYRYSNSGYFLLTEIIKRVTKMSYASWVKENIFIPLDMQDSYINENNKIIYNNLSNSYKKKELYDNVEVPTSSYLLQPENLWIYTVQTTINDYAKWLVNYRTGKIGGRKTLELIETGIHQDPDAWNWAFGFQKTKYKGVNQKLSQGIIQGYRTHVSSFVEKDLSVLYFSNDGEWRTFYLANKITDILLQNSISHDELNSSYSYEQDKVNDNDSKKLNVSELEINNSIEGVYINQNISKNFSIEKFQTNAEIKLFGLQGIKLELLNPNEYKTDKWYMSKIIFNEDENISTCKVYNSRNGDYVLFNKLNKLNE